MNVRPYADVFRGKTAISLKIIVKKNDTLIIIIYNDSLNSGIVFFSSSSFEKGHPVCIWLSHDIINDNKRSFILLSKAKWNGWKKSKDMKKPVNVK